MKTLSPIARAIDYFKSLPGVGPRMAERMAYHIIKNKEEYADNFSKAIAELKQSVGYCSVCSNFSEGDKCLICSDNMRQSDVICVVEDVQDLLAIEKTNCFSGLYHVLHGRLSPLDGIGPEDLTLSLFMERMKINQISEVIIATNPNVEGEATATYIAQLLNAMKIKVTRIAQGLPRGGDLEYADGYTLKKAFEGRREI